MPPRHAYWTIIVDDQPTSFRAHDVEELLPTFNRLREKHPTAQLKWFERGQLFDTRDAAREQGYGKGERRWEGPRPDREAADVDGEGGESRPRDKNWRPGGQHRDPRQKYKDAKKAKWQQFKQNIRSRWDEKQERRRDDDARVSPEREPFGREGGPAPPKRERFGREGGPASPKRERFGREGGPASPKRERFGREGGPASPKRERFGREGGPPPMPDHGDHTPPHGDPIRPKLEPRREGWRDRPPRAGDRDSRSFRETDREGGPAPPKRDRFGREGGWRPKGPPRGDRQREDWRRDDRHRDRDDRPREFRRDDDRRGGWKPKGPPRDRGEWKPKGPPRDRDRTEWKPKGPPRGDRKPWGGKPAGGGARKPWGSKPGGGRKPFGSKPSGGGFRKKPFGAGPPRPRGPKKRRDDDE